MKEPLYNFSCGCTFKKSQSISARRNGSSVVVCPDHPNSDLVGRFLYCKTCGWLFKSKSESGNPAKNCPAHIQRKPKYTKVLKKKTGRKLPPKIRYLRGKDHCKTFEKCKLGFKINCISCDRFEPVFFGHDHKKRYDLMWIGAA